MNSETSRALARQLTYTVFLSHDRLSIHDWNTLTGFPGSEYCLLTIEIAISNALNPEVCKGNLPSYSNPLLERATSWLRGQAENPLVHAVMLHWSSFSPNLKKDIWQLLFEVGGVLDANIAAYFLSRNNEQATYIPLTTCLKHANVTEKWSVLPVSSKESTTEYVNAYWRQFRNWKEGLPFGRFASLTDLDTTDNTLKDALLRAAIWQADGAYLKRFGGNFSQYVDLAVNLLLEERVIENGYFRNRLDRDRDSVAYAKNLFLLSEMTVDYLSSQLGESEKKIMLANRILKQGQRPWIWTVSKRLVGLCTNYSLVVQFLEHWIEEEHKLSRYNFSRYLQASEATEHAIRSFSYPDILDILTLLPVANQIQYVQNNGLESQWLHKFSQTKNKINRHIALTLIKGGKLDAQQFLTVSKLWSYRPQKRLTKIWLANLENECKYMPDYIVQELAHRLTNFGLAAGKLFSNSIYFCRELYKYGYQLHPDDIQPGNAKEFLDNAPKIWFEPSAIETLINLKMGEDLLLTTILPSLFVLLGQQSQMERYFEEHFKWLFEREPKLQEYLFRAAWTETNDIPLRRFIISSSLWREYPDQEFLHEILAEYVNKHEERLIQLQPEYYAELVANTEIRRKSFFKHAETNLQYFVNPRNYEDLFTTAEDRKRLSIWLLKHVVNDKNFVEWVSHFKLLETGSIKPSHLKEYLHNSQSEELINSILDLLSAEDASA